MPTRTTSLAQNRQLQQMHKSAAHLDVRVCVGLRCVPNEHAVTLGVVAGTNCCGLDLHLSPAAMRASIRTLSQWSGPEGLS